MTISSIQINLPMCISAAMIVQSRVPKSKVSAVFLVFTASTAESNSAPKPFKGNEHFAGASKQNTPKKVKRAAGKRLDSKPCGVIIKNSAGLPKGQAVGEKRPFTGEDGRFEGSQEESCRGLSISQGKRIGRMMKAEKVREWKERRVCRDKSRRQDRLDKMALNLGFWREGYLDDKPAEEPSRVKKGAREAVPYQAPALPKPMLSYLQEGVDKVPFHPFFSDEKSYFDVEGHVVEALSQEPLTEETSSTGSEWSTVEEQSLGSSHVESVTPELESLSLGSAREESEWLFGVVKAFDRLHEQDSDTVGSDAELDVTTPGSSRQQSFGSTEMVEEEAGREVDEEDSESLANGEESLIDLACVWEDKLRL